MNIRGCKYLDIAKPGAVLCQEMGAEVSQLVRKLKESVTPPPPVVLRPRPASSAMLPIGGNCFKRPTLKRKVKMALGPTGSF